MQTIKLVGQSTFPDHTFVLYHANQDFLHRRSRRLISPRKDTIELLLVIALVCLLFLGIWTVELSNWVQLTRYGRATPGVVLGHRSEKGSAYYLIYQYNVPVKGGALRMQGEVRVPYDVYSPKNYQLL